MFCTFFHRSPKIDFLALDLQGAELDVFFIFLKYLLQSSSNF